MSAAFDLNGKWTGTVKTPEGDDQPVTYNFRVDGDQLSGTAESPAGVVTVDSGKVVDSAFSFKITVDGTDYPHRGTIVADALTVDMDFGGQKVQITLRRG